MLKMAEMQFHLIDGVTGVNGLEILNQRKERPGGLQLNAPPKAILRYSQLLTAYEFEKAYRVVVDVDISSSLI